MQISDIKHRQKSSNKQQNGEKRRSEDEKKKESVIRDSFSPGEEKKYRFSAAEKKKSSVIIRESFTDVKFCVSLMCLALSVIVAWLHLQQSATLAEMREKYEYLQEKSRSVEELDEKLTEVSQQLQASADAATLLSNLRLSLGSVLNTSAALREHQDSASRRLHTHTQQSAELRALHTHSRGAHTQVAEQVNTLEERLRGLEERLQEVQDGVRGNTRALERTEEEELRRVRELAERSDSSVSRLQERLERLAAQARGLQERLREEEEAGRAQQDEEAALEEAVRSMLRVRALLSATRRRVQELEEQCALLSPVPVSAQTSALSAELSRLQESVSGLSSRQQELQQDLARAVGDEVSRTRAVASIRTDLRRVTGLQTELEALLTHTHGLEQELSRTERLMVKRIGDALAGSIARTSELKSSAESSGRTLDRTHTLLQQLSDDIIKLSERVLALESGRAKLRRTLSFTHDLKPTVFSVRQDLALLQPKLDDLTLRIGLLAADMTSRERELEDEPTGDALDPTP